MPYDPEIHQRRSIRLRGYDYSSPGQYFVTICVRRRKCLYGEVVDGEMNLNGAGQMVEKWWQELARKFPLVELDEHVTMPNHFHCIIEIVDRRKREKDMFHAGMTKDQIALAMEPLPEKSAPLPEIVQWFKTMTTNEYIRGVKQLDWPRFEGKLWQRNYYEHVIFGIRSQHNIRRYIQANPAMWPYDRDNTAATAPDREKVRESLTSRFNITEEEIDFILEFDDDFRDEETLDDCA